MGSCTLDYLAKVLFYTRGNISDEALQMIIRDYFLVFLYVLNAREYFIPENRDSRINSPINPHQYPYKSMKNEYKNFIERGRMQILLPHYDNTAFLYREMTQSFGLYFRVFMDDGFKENVLLPHLMSTVQNYYKAKQSHLIQMHYPHKKNHRKIGQPRGPHELMEYTHMYNTMENDYVLGATLNEQDVMAYIDSLDVSFLDE